MQVHNKPIKRISLNMENLKVRTLTIKARGKALYKVLLSQSLSVLFLIGPTVRKTGMRSKAPGPVSTLSTHQGTNSIPSSEPEMNDPSTMHFIFYHRYYNGLVS